MTRNVEELFGGVITAPHQIPFTYKSSVGGETFISLPFYPVAGVVTINGGVQVPLDNFEIDGNTLNLGRALSKDDVVYCLFDKILSPEDTSKGIRIYKFQAVGGETEFTPDFTSYGVQSLYIGGEYKTPDIEYSYNSTTGKVSLQTALTAGVWVVAEMSVKQPNISPAFDRSIQEIARSANVKDSEVIVSTDTISLLDDKKVVYDSAAQIIYGLPIIPDGSVISSVSDGKLTYNPGGVQVDLLPLPDSAENIMNVIHDEFLSPSGGSLINYKLPFSSSVVQPLLGHLGLHVSVRDFGATGDGITDEKVAFMAAFDYMKSVGGGTLLVPPGNYFFGDYSTSDFVLDIQDTHNVRVIGYGATFSVRSTEVATPFLFALRGCNNWVFEGCSFIDLGFDPSAWLSHQRWGMAAICVRPTTGYNSGLTVKNCTARNMTYFVLSDQTTAEGNLRSFGDFDISNCHVENAYYGVDLLYVGGTTRVDMNCKDVRRGFISYGQRNTDIRINLYTSSGFLGSNAFVSLACEGYAQQRNGVPIGAQCLVDNIRVRVNVTGYEAHSAYVHCYHQQDADSQGSISNIDAQVQLDYLSTAGKNPLVGVTNVFALRHETPTGTIATTTRRFHNVKMDCQIAGTISGKVIAFESVNTSDPHVLEMSKQMMRYASDIDLARWVVAAIWNCAIKVQLTGFTTAFNPIGTTTVGAPTGLILDGYLIKDGNTVTVNGRIRYTSHTGTGQMRLDNVPFASANSVNLGLLTCSVISGTRPTGVLWGNVAGAASKQVVFSSESVSGWSVYNVSAGETEIAFMGSYQSVQ